jgi:hypothetical protein
VSGLATQAISPSTLRSRHFPISARVARSELLNLSFDGTFVPKIRFSAARFDPRYCSSVTHLSQWTVSL